MATEEPCAHFAEVEDVGPSGNGCVECLAAGGRWVHLRMCMECGHVGCCDQSPGRHATGHFRETNHAVLQSFEPGEDWWWCYVDETASEPAGLPQFQHT